MPFVQYVIWIPLLPLIGVLINGLVAPFLPEGVRRRVVSIVGPGTVLLSFLLTLGIATQVLGAAGHLGVPEDQVYWDWIGSAGNRNFIHVPVGFRLDALSITMALVVTGVGSLIHCYSTGYMRGDERYHRYFAFLNLFMFAMLILVLANNYVLMFVGWEGVGLCSYLLIGFWFDRDTAASAGKKAFLINRVGDFGFLLGIIAIYWLMASTGKHSLTFTDVDEVFSNEAALAQIRLNLTWGIPLMSLAALALFLGATGKSAQLPLYMWLPDAMEGPTPVSALIHAATMVTAGVYLIARSAVLFDAVAAISPWVQSIIVYVAVATAILGALVAIGQTDIKRVLAYSTVSQLGYMFIGVGAGAYAAGVSHLVTHAFFKALLFLAAGAVIHALGNEQDIRKMGGLSRKLKITAFTAGIATLTIAGFPGFAAFYSKDAVIASALAQPHLQVAGWLALVVAAMTAFYMVRWFLMVFSGSSRVSDGVHVHKEDWRMSWPLVVLAILSVVGGWMVQKGFVPGHDILGYMHFGAPEAGHPASQMPISEGGLLGLSFAAFLVGVIGAVTMHNSGAFVRGWSPGAENAFGLVRRSYESSLHFLVVRLGTMAADLVWSLIDVLIIDGIVNRVAWFVTVIAENLRTLQTGYVRNYALVMLAGVVFLVLCFLVFVHELSRTMVWSIVGGFILVSALVVTLPYLFSRLRRTER